jgi:hypothetical protein
VKGCRSSTAACWNGDTPGTPVVRLLTLFSFVLKCHEANWLRGIKYPSFITAMVLPPLGGASHNFFVYEIRGEDTYLIAKVHIIVDTLTVARRIAAKISQYLLHCKELLQLG